eukprot:6030939-Pyramimonas_sp.AAC.1
MISQHTLQCCNTLANAAMRPMSMRCNAPSNAAVHPSSFKPHRGIRTLWSRAVPYACCSASFNAAMQALCRGGAGAGGGTIMISEDPPMLQYTGQCCNAPDVNALQCTLQCCSAPSSFKPLMELERSGPEQSQARAAMHPPMLQYTLQRCSAPSNAAVHPPTLQCTFQCCNTPSNAAMHPLAPSRHRGSRTSGDPKALLILQCDVKFPLPLLSHPARSNFGPGRCPSGTLRHRCPRTGEERRSSNASQPPQR